MKLEDILKRDNNNFTLIRLIAALFVIYGHSFSLFTTNGYSEPVRQLLKFTYTGSIAVYIFFFLSGIFITASFVNSKSITRFLLMRLFRIWPALIVCVSLTVFIVGPLFSSYPISEYFALGLTWKYLIKNTTLLWPIEMQLPGVFNKNHYISAVNGSLWTLPIEVRCYCVVLFAGCIGLLKKPYYIIAVFSILIILSITNGLLFFNIPNVLAGKEVWFFMAGGIVYGLRKYVVIDYKIALILIIILLLLRNTPVFELLFYITLCYGVLTVGAAALLKKVHLPGDYSYGIYIYGFLVQQMVSYNYLGITSYRSLFIVIPATFILAVLSWHFIEFPANKLAKSIAVKINK